MNSLHAAIDANAERALAEIKLMSAVAIKQIRRMADFHTRSQGQIRRFARQRQEIINNTPA